MTGYTYEIQNEENAFGAHLGYWVVLYGPNGKRKDSWHFDDLALGRFRMRRKVRELKELYGAVVQ